MRKKMDQKGLAGVLAIGAFAIATIVCTAINRSLLGGLRQVFLLIDTFVFSISTWAYSIFYEISSSSLLSLLNLAAASQRLYTLLGIFMLFRLAFSFIKFIINPEGMEKGTSKLLSNLAVSLALIVSVPWIFNRAFALQTYIMDSNVIGNLILGINKSNNSKNNEAFNASSMGQQIAFLTFSAFYRPDSSIPTLSSCGNLLLYYDDNLLIEGSGLSPDNGQKGPLTNEQKKIVECVNALNDNSKNGINYEGNSAVEIGTLFYIASQRYSIGVLTDPAVFMAFIGNQYVVEYTAIASTAAGVFLALMFLNFCFDVAIRNVKLCFLQIIAPIPIILNIEPGDAKGDKKPLNWWTKECLKTYVDLFVRVATVYFGVYLITTLFGDGFSSVAGSTNTSSWFKVFMILGILLFIKQIPDLIGKAFGIDVKGQFSLNPLKRIGDSRLASMAVGGAIGGATGLLNSGVAAYAGARSNGASRGEAIRRAITGGIDGAAHSTISGAKKGVKSIHDITGNVKENLARSGRIAGANVGTTWRGRTAAKLSTAVGGKTRADKDKEIIDANSNLEKSVNDLYAYAGSEIMKKNGTEAMFGSDTSKSISNFYAAHGTTDKMFDMDSKTGKVTFKIFDPSTGRYRKSTNASYSIGDYKAELATFNSARSVDTSHMTIAARRTYNENLVEMERELAIKKKFIEGQAAAEILVGKNASGDYVDSKAAAMAGNIVRMVESNETIFGNPKVMGVGNTLAPINTKAVNYLADFVGDHSKDYANSAASASKIYSLSPKYERHLRESEAAKVNRGPGGGN